MPNSKFDEFIKNPTGETYIAALDELAISPGYDPYGIDMAEINQMYGREEFDRVIATIVENLATLRLSAEAHAFMAESVKKLGDDDLWEMEDYLTKACIRGIVRSGRGTRDEPHHVSVVGDEHFFLGSRIKEMSRQSLFEHGDRMLDVWTIRAGGELCFDVTRPYNRMTEQMRTRSDDPQAGREQ